MQTIGMKFLFLFDFINTLFIDDLASNRLVAPHRRRPTHGLEFFVAYTVH